MTSFVALLRGVNVGGITIRSAELGELFRTLGFARVRTVLASGNVVFESDETDAAQLKARIEAALRERFGYDAWIVLLAEDKLAEIVAGFPFDAERAGWHPYVLFASDPAHLAELLDAAPTLDPAEELVAAGDGVLYWQLNIAVGSLNTKLAKLAAKPRFKPTTTTRNLRTLKKLL
jgi:uncharacterized protein (DUF1697 family)